MDRKNYPKEDYNGDINTNDAAVYGNQKSI